ncbi:hypothetical protein ACFE04_001448 [Oxalis oulophora]
MDYEQYLPQEWNSNSGGVSESGENRGCFDCNICLDIANEPVVTLCGHLYCWPCIYNWLQVQKSDSLNSDEPSQCPVCKADISETTMVPLYGRGSASNEPDCKGKAQEKDIATIPPRPKAYGVAKGQQLRNLHEAEQNNDPNTRSSLNVDLPSPYPSMQHPVVGMFGELVYTRVFGNSDSLYAYPNVPNSYNYTLGSNSRPRIRRRQEMQADKSLNRISMFLFCFFLLCLIVF